MFNAALPLPGAVGAANPGIAIDSSGTVYAIASDGTGLGCVVDTYSHDGSSAHFLGRPPGGAGCTAAIGPTQQGTAPVNASGELAYGALGTNGVIGARSTSAGASFTSALIPAVTAAGPQALATDPLVGSGGFATTYLLVRDATTGLPRLAISVDGGLTYAVGGSPINAADVDPTLWQGSGPMAVAGNLVARRDDTGLKLYSVIATADSAADRSAQATAGTDNLNRVYGAVGTVVASLTPGTPPTVAWHDVEAFAAPAGTGLNRPLPVTAVDSAGHVSIAYADGHHVYAKSDVDGSHWNAGAAAVQLDKVAAGVPAAMDSSLAPAIAAGGNGIVDVAWYGAIGGDATLPDPATDAHNNWAVYMAQSLDSGATWTAYAVTASAVHQGALCAVGDAACAAAQQTPPDPNIGDTLQLAVDQVSGAAEVVYADDSQTPGLPVLEATRQCGALSAVSGQALVNDCVDPQPASGPVGAGTCPGPQITDVAGDAIDSSAGGGGAILRNLDLLQVNMNEPQSDGQIQVAITVSHLDAQPAAADITAMSWRAYWTFKGTPYYADATVAAGHQPVFTVGTVSPDGTLGPGTAIAGALVPGPDGEVVLTIPVGDVGFPATGALLHDFNAASYAVYTPGGATAGTPVLVDRAPDGGFGAPPMIGQCPPAADIPEVPMAVLLPLGAGFAGVMLMVLRRKRSAASVNNSSAGGIPVGQEPTQPARSSERAE